MNLPNKFQCHYRLTLQWEENGEVFHAVVTDPITIHFNVTKAVLSDVNSAIITIYNLDAVTRESIYQDKLLLNPTKRKMLTLEAGYGESLTLVCLGYIQQCYSERQGTDFITEIEVLDPDVLTQYTSVTFDAGTTFDEAYKFLVSQFPNLKQGECGVLNGTFNSPTVFEGNGFWVINELTGGHTFVDNGVINTLNDNEVLEGYQTYLISDETGLLDTPKRYDAILEINMLFEPTIRVGQLVEIKSSTWAAFDGQFKVLGYTHNCMISGSVGGTRTTTLQLQYLRYLTNSNINLTNNPEGTKPAKVKGNKTTPVNIPLSGDILVIYTYIKTHNGQVPRIPITNRITWWEMFYSNSKNKPADVKDAVTLEKLRRCKQIAENLTNFLNDNYPGKKITILSGCRTPQNNANTEGSAKGSNHVKGMAIDFAIKGVPLAEYKAVFKNGWAYGIGLKYKWGIHVSMDPNERF